MHLNSEPAECRKRTCTGDLNCFVLESWAANMTRCHHCCRGTRAAALARAPGGGWRLQLEGRAAPAGVGDGDAVAARCVGAHCWLLAASCCGSQGLIPRPLRKIQSVKFVPAHSRSNRKHKTWHSHCRQQAEAAEFDVVVTAMSANSTRRLLTGVFDAAAADAAAIKANGRRGIPPRVCYCTGCCMHRLCCDSLVAAHKVSSHNIFAHTLIT